MMNNAETPQLTIPRVRRSVLVEFLHNDHKVFDKTYWEDDNERYEDIKQWQSESPMKRVRYVD